MLSYELRKRIAISAPWQLVQRVINRLRRPQVYLGDHTLILRTNLGHVMYVDTRDTSLTPYLLIHGVWEANVTKLMLRLLKPGMRVVEVGGNIGYYSILSAWLVGPEGRVTTFEAQERQAALNQRSLNVNGVNWWTKVERTAISDSVGTVEFHALTERHGSSSLFPHDTEEMSALADQVEIIQVPCTTLDEHFGDDIEGIGFIKMDVEGAEPRVFEGMEKLLAANPRLNIMMEFSPRMIRASDRDPREFLSQVQQLGFTLNLVDQRGQLQATTIDDAIAAEHCELLLDR